MNLHFGGNYNSITIINQFIEDNNEFILYGQKHLALRIEKVLKTKYNKTLFHFIPHNNDLEETLTSTSKIIITSFHETVIAFQLFQRFGFKYGKNFIFFDHILNNEYVPKTSIGAEFVNFYKLNQENFQKTFEILSDEYSKNIFSKVLNLRANLLNIENIEPKDLPTTYEQQLDYETKANNYLKDLNLINDRQLKNHIAFTLSLNAYSYSNKISPKNKQIILNAGAYNTTSVMFSIMSPKAKIFAFEPQKNIHEDNVQISKEFKNIIPVNNGVWSETTKVFFNIDEEQSTASSICKKGTNSIDVISIDDFCEINNLKAVDFIKMDIEGAEIEALRGASKVIKTQTPDLAISIYHKPEHLYEIPLFIKQLVPEYKIFIDHKYYNYTETVCFATIN